MKLYVLFINLIIIVFYFWCIIHLFYFNSSINPYFYSLTLSKTLICPAGAFWAKYLISCESKVACKFLKKTSQSALNQVLTLPDYRTQKMLQIPLKIIDLQNDFNMLVAKQWKIRISVPMSYIMCFFMPWQRRIKKLVGGFG